MLTEHEEKVKLKYIACRILGVVGGDSNLNSRHEKPNRRLRPRTLTDDFSQANTTRSSAKVIYGVMCEFHIEASWAALLCARADKDAADRVWHFDQAKFHVNIIRECLNLTLSLREREFGPEVNVACAWACRLESCMRCALTCTRAGSNAFLPPRSKSFLIWARSGAE